MTTASRFNLSLLRKGSVSRLGVSGNKTISEIDKSLGELSRRDFLTLTGSSAAGAVIPNYFRGDGFQVRQEGQALHVMTGGQPRWSIDASMFGGRATVSLKRAHGRMDLALRHAVFAGTDLPADLHAVLQRRGRTWFLKLQTAYGLDFAAELLPWLEGAGGGKGELAAGILRPLAGMTILQGRGSATFSPAWEVHTSGGSEVHLEQLDKRFQVAQWRMSPFPDEQLAGGPESPRTMFRFTRANAAWDVPLRRSAPAGWSIDHAGGLFDELCVEGLSRGKMTVLSALLQGTGRSLEDVRFLPGGGLLSDFAEPFHLSLRSPRLLVCLNAGAPESALVADLPEHPVWAHSRSMSVQLGGHPETPPFELLEGGATQGRAAQPTVTPHVLRADIPCENGSTISVTFNEKHPMPFNWATAVQGVERFVSGLDLMPWENGLALDLSGDHVVRLLRAKDQFHLKFRFSNVRLHAGFLESFFPFAKADKVAEPGVHCRPKPGTVPRITVIFPPQHVAERAFYEQLAATPTQPGAVELSRGLTENSTTRPATVPTPVDIPPAALEPDGTNPKDETKYMAVESRVANESQLVFDLPPKQHVPFTFESLLNWKAWTPTIANIAKTQGARLPKDCPDAYAIEDPTDRTTSAYATAIEMPYRVMLSPSEMGAWAHETEARERTGFTELWHTRLAVADSKKNPNEQDAANRVVSAIWSPDFTDASKLQKPHDGVASLPPRTLDKLRVPFRTSLDGRDRDEFVHLTSDFTIPGGFVPTPLRVDKMFLSPMGGSLSSFGAWNPPRLIDNPTDPNNFLSVEQWKEDIEWSREQYGRVVYKGYLLPFGHPASLVKVTERVFREVSDLGKMVWGAVQRQYMYLVIQHPRRDYPLLGQNYKGLQLPFKRIDALTLSTPAIDDPGDQTRFWPTVGGPLFQFEFQFFDWDGNRTRATAPVVFVDRGVAQVDLSASAAVAFYQTGYNGDLKALTSDFFGQQVAFATPNKPGDTAYNVASMTWAASKLNANAELLYRADLPFFGPGLASAKITPSTVSRISGTDPTDPASQTVVSYFPNYLESGFDPNKNRGEVMLQVTDKPLPLQFGGQQQHVDKGGGLLSPDSLVVGYSRSAGPVGGKMVDVTTASVQALARAHNLAGPITSSSSSLQVHAAGDFDPASFFGGLASAKILGAVRLSDVIGSFAQGIGSSIGKVPQMLETALGSADNAIYDAEDIFMRTVFEPMQTEVETVPALQRRLGAMATLVRSTWQQAKAAHVVTAAASADDRLLDEILEAQVHAQFIGAIRVYADAVTKIVQNPTAAAEEAALDALLYQFNSITPNPLKAFQAILYQAYDTFVSDLIAGAAAVVNGAIAGLNAIAGKLTAAVSDPFADSDPETLKHVVYGDLIPEMRTCLEALPIAQDLVVRLKTVAASKKTGVGRVEEVLGSLGPIASDLLHLEEKFGFVGLVLAEQGIYQGALKTAKDQQDLIINALQTWLGPLDFVALLANTLAVADVCAIFGEAQTSVDEAKNLLQQARQLQRAAQKLKDATVKLVGSSGTLRWRCALLERQALRQCLESLQALHLYADGIADPYVQALAARQAALAAQTDAINRFGAGSVQAQQAATALAAAQAAVPATATAHPDAFLAFNVLSACAVVEAQLPVAQWLIHDRAACLVPIADLRGAEAMASRLSALDSQMNQLATDWAATRKLDTSLQFLNAWQQYQGPLAAVYGWTVWGFQEVDGLVQYANWVAGEAATIQQAATSVKTDFDKVHQAIQNLQKPGQLDGALLGSAQALSTMADALDNALGQAGINGAPVSSVLGSTADALTAAAQVVAEVDAEIHQLEELVHLAEQLPRMLQDLPKAVSIQLSLDWHPNIRSFEPVFRLEAGADLVVRASTVISLDPAHPPSFSITATLTNFSINLIGDPSFIIITFDSFTFKSESGSKPNCDLKIKSVTFGSAMSFVQELASLLDPSEGPFIEFANGMLNAGYRFAVPTIPVGVFLLTQLKLEVSVGLPFDGDPVRCYLAISEQFNPFLLTCGIYSGGGYLLMRLGLDGVERLEGSLDFGVSAVINVGPLVGYGEVLAGIHFAVGGGSSEVCGFVFAHGHCDILGIISLDVKVNVDICYESDSHGGTSVVGEADFTVDIEILFFSASYTFTAQYTFAGSGRNSPADEQAAIAQHAVLTKAALAAGRPAPPARTKRVDPKYAVDAHAWEEYFNSFDPFPQEVNF